ncbi:hypothetical protein KYX74_12940, partial [Enterococcus lactis]|uniref:hypothetical protein n=1 Tax=Enterococcus lactis TaxID=357441 RepID=UPI001C7D7CD3
SSSLTRQNLYHRLRRDCRKDISDRDDRRPQRQMHIRDKDERTPQSKCHKQHQIIYPRYSPF